MVAEVIVDIAHSEVDKIFDYSCDESVKEGCRVKVPFGKTFVTGFVVKIKEQSDCPLRLKSVAEVYDGIPAINGECLSLAREISERYRVPMALSLRLFLPSEMRTGKVKELFRRIAEISEDNAAFSKTAKAQAAAYEYIKANNKADCAVLNEKFGLFRNKSSRKQGIYKYIPRA